MLLVVAVSLLLPLGALESSPPSSESVEPVSAPSWSIGAGLSFGGLSGWSLTPPVTGLTGLTGLSVLTSVAPGVTTSLERSLGERLWLLVGLSGAIATSQRDAGSSTSRGISGQIGVRYVLTQPGAMADVSVLALLNGGLDDLSLSSANLAAGSVRGASNWSIGLSGGLAVERQLASGLSVRIATSLISAGYSRGKITYVDAADVMTTGFSAGLVLAPRLELRMAF